MLLLSRFWWCALCFFLVKIPVYAEFSVDPYKVQVPQQADEQTTVALGLERALMRATGSVAILELPETEKLMAAPMRFVSSMRRVDSQSVIQFSGPALEAFIREQNQTIWERMRPNIGVWFLIDTDNQPYILRQGDASPWSEFSMDAAQDFGLPLALPQPALLQDVRPSDLRGLFFSSIEKEYSAQQRPDALLIVRVFKASDNVWHMKWELKPTDAAQRHLALTGQHRGDAREVVFDMTQEISGYLASLFRVDQMQAQQWFPVRVEHITRNEDIVKMRARVLALSLVDAATVSKVGSDWVEFNIKVQGNVDDLKRTFALMPDWSAQSEQSAMKSTVMGSVDVPLRYVFRRR